MVVNTFRNWERFLLPKESLNDNTTVTNSPAEKGFDNFKSRLKELLQSNIVNTPVNNSER